MGNDYPTEGSAPGTQDQGGLTSLLLDFPWPLEAVLGEEAEPNFALQQFFGIVRQTGLAPVRFVDLAEQIALWENAEAMNKAGNQWSALYQLLEHCAREAAGNPCQARPQPEPPGLRPSWKQALRDELLADPAWRTPQILIPRKRRAAWGNGDEATLICEKCGHMAASTHRRVLVALEEYADHRFATSDFDPWNLRRLHPGAGEAEKPCRLPRPPMPPALPLGQLHDHIVEAERLRCRRNGKYYYVPPTNWHPDADQHRWRAGEAFPQGTAEGRSRSGYLDCEGKVWEWDDGERHWDVQYGGRDNYVTVSHDGRVLKCPAHLARKIAW